VRLLKLSDIQAIISQPVNAENIARLLEQESILRTYSEPLSKDLLKNEKGFSLFKQGLRDSLKNENRAKRIEEFITYPMECTSISDSILKELKKVFDSSNSFFNIEGQTPEIVGEAWRLIKEVDLGGFIRKNASEVMRSKANSIVLINFDVEGGQPSLQLIPMNEVIDFKLKNKNGELEYLVLDLGTMQDEEDKYKYYGVYDSDYYRVVIQKNEDEPQIAIENPHVLEECPARFFWSDSISDKNENFRMTPLWPVVGNLEKWQRFSIFKFYADHYGPFPILERISAKCPNQNCKGGKIESTVSKTINGVVQDIPVFSDCQICSANKNSIFGPGSTVDIKPPTSKDEFDPSGKTKFISLELDGIKYINDDVLKEGEKRIFHKVVGAGSLLEKEAVNEMQVLGSFESRQQVLIDLKKNLDNLYKWCGESLLKLYYGSNIDITVTADYGTQFYLYSPEDIYKEYDNAKKSGMSESILGNLWNMYVETKWKENPVEVTRLKILKQIEPVPFKTYLEAQQLRNDGVISNDDLIVKGNFTNLVARFEREQAPIVYFGSELEMDKRVNRIKEIIYSYIKTKEDGTGNV